MSGPAPWRIASYRLPCHVSVPGRPIAHLVSDLLTVTAFAADEAE